MDWREVLRRQQNEPVRVDELEQALRPMWPQVAVTGTALLEGGLASVLHRIELTGGPVPVVVLRRLLTEFGDDASTVERERTVHRTVPALGVPVPRVHWTDPSGDVLGSPALVIDHVPGRLLLGDLPQEAARAAFATAIHAVHDVRAEQVPTLPVLRDVAAHADRFGAPASGSRLVDEHRLDRAISTGSRWFSGGQCLVHCDLHAGNVLWSGATVTGVLDWSGAAVGAAGMDEAYAWLDTALAHGRPVADLLEGELDAQRQTPPAPRGEVRLWRACALRRALPTPAPWAEAYRAAGVDVTDAQVEERFVQLVEDELGGD